MDGLLLEGEQITDTEGIFQTLNVDKQSFFGLEYQDWAGLNQWIDEFPKRLGPEHHNVAVFLEELAKSCSDLGDEARKEELLAKARWIHARAERGKRAAEGAAEEEAVVAAPKRWSQRFFVEGLVEAFRCRRRWRLGLAATAAP